VWISRLCSESRLNKSDQITSLTAFHSLSLNHSLALTFRGRNEICTGIVFQKTEKIGGKISLAPVSGEVTPILLPLTPFDSLPPKPFPINTYSDFRS